MARISPLHTRCLLPAMTGGTREHDFGLKLLGHEFFINAVGHFDHVAGHVFFRLCIRNKIPLAERGSFLAHMAMVAFHSQGLVPALHDGFKVVSGSAFRQYFQVLRFCGPGPGIFWLKTKFAEYGNGNDQCQNGKFVSELLHD